MDYLRSVLRTSSLADDVKSFDSSTLKHTETKVTESMNLNANCVESGAAAAETTNESAGLESSWVEGFLVSNKDLEKYQTSPREQRVPNRGFAIKIEEALTKDECQYLIDRCENKGFEPALLNVGYGRQVLDTSTRNSLRCIHDDPQLCQELWRRIAPFVAKASSKRHFGGSTRTLVPRELNERLRILKYTSEPGNPNYFKAHCDGSYPRPRSHPNYPDVSKYTVLIYLNGGFKGGSTRLYKSGESEYDDCFPSAGRILIHDHGILHEGMQVEEGTGTKYVIRTDIMCTFQPNTSGACDSIDLR